MNFYSTNDRRTRVNLREAVLRGLAPDNGLFMPERIDKLPKGFLSELKHSSFKELSFAVARHLLGDSLSENILGSIIEQTVQFDAPVVPLGQDVWVLELFHGPTLAFKDFGARFLASMLGYFARDESREISILVATSGDTGSAVANGFLDVPGTRVIVLYPSGKVSALQEKQFTTLGGNITALEVEGTFDDCQRLVKSAFLDKEVNSRSFLTSANSINIARLIPQTFYYFKPWIELAGEEETLTFAVPSGNFGNLTAGLIAKKMGLPARFVAATNANDVVPEAFRTGTFTARPSVATISNAMDVGNPSNYARMMDLYDGDIAKLKSDVAAFSFSDQQTRNAMRSVNAEANYILDPHGAVAYCGLMQFQNENGGSGKSIVLETAHPGKFRETVEETLGRAIEIPKRLSVFGRKKKKSIAMRPHFAQLKEFLLS